MFITNNKMLLGIPALERGLDVLERISGTDLPLTLTTIARSCGRSVSELQRVVACLHRRGYLLRDGTGAYRVSSKLFRMGQACPPFQDLLTRSRAPMREFAQRTGEAVHISVMAEDRLLILANVPGPGYVQLGVNAGSTHDPIISASGKVLLATMPSADFDAFIKRNGVKPHDVKSLRRQLTAIRLRGYEYVESHLFCGVYDLALAVTMPGGQCVATVACSWLRPRNRATGGEYKAVQSLLPKLRDCAAQIIIAFEPAPTEAHPSAKEVIP